MKFILLSVLIVVCCLTGHSASDVSDWITTQGECVAYNITTQEAIKRAEEIAKRNAIEQYCGTKVQSETYVKNFQLQSDFISAISYGEIIDFKRLKVEREDYRKTETDDFIDLIRVTVQVKIAKGKSQPDPYFVMQVKLGKTVFNHGEKSALTITASKDCYITIFNIIEDRTIYQIYPTTMLKSVKLTANTPWVFPQQMTAMCPDGKSRTIEILKIVATKEPLPLLDSGKDDVVEYNGIRIWSRPEIGFNDLARQMAAIPLNERTEATITYEVVR